MTIEEKARAYDEALALMEDCVPDKDGYVCVRPCDIFHELAESEDERIRKEFCKDIWTYIPNEKAHRYIAWLEKHGAQKAILDELEMTLSVSEDAYLRSNLEKLIKELKKEKQQ